MCHAFTLISKLQALQIKKIPPNPCTYQNNTLYLQCYYFSELRDSYGKSVGVFLFLADIL